MSSLCANWRLWTRGNMSDASLHIWWNPTHAVSSPWSQMHRGLPSVLGMGGLLCVSQLLEASVHETGTYCWQRVRLDKSLIIVHPQIPGAGAVKLSLLSMDAEIWTPPLRYHVLSGRTKKKYSSEIPFIWLLTWEIAQQLKDYTTPIMQCQADSKF